MHLKVIKLRGFKSFVDPVEVRLESGVSVVVGPNIEVFGGQDTSGQTSPDIWAFTPP